VHRQFFDRCAEGQDKEAPAVCGDDRRHHHVGKREHRCAGQLVHQSVQRRKAVEFDCGHRVGAQPQKHNQSHAEPDHAGQHSPEHGADLYEHHRVERQVGGAVQLCAEAAGELQTAGQPAVQYIAQACERVDCIKLFGEGGDEQECSGCGDAQKCDAVGNVPIQSGGTRSGFHSDSPFLVKANRRHFLNRRPPNYPSRFFPNRQEEIGIVCNDNCLKRICWACKACPIWLY